MPEATSERGGASRAGTPSKACTSALTSQRCGPTCSDGSPDGGLR
jgi:hypothetical protein